MTRATLALLVLLTASPSLAQEVPAAHLSGEWQLLSIDGQPFTAVGKIDLSTAGQISGQGPCNRFSASHDGTLPDFRPSAIAATKMACADLAAESAMFAALGAMTRAEVTGPATLLLTGPKGGSMEFVRR